MRIAVAVFVFFLSVISACPGAGEAGTLVIPGTGACEATLKGLALAFERSHPMTRVVVPPSIHSGGGIRQVVSGEAVLARVSRTLTPEEAGKKLAYRVFARDAVVFAAGAAVRPRPFTIREIVDIFTGKVDRWEQLGAGKGPIRVLLREEGDSSLKAIRSRYPEFRDLRFTGQAKILYHDNDMVEMLQKYRNAIGFVTASSLGTGSATVTPLSIDGVAPTRENVSSGRYPVRIEYAIVHAEGDLPPEAREFVDFLFTPAGRKVLSDGGLTPVEG